MMLALHSSLPETKSRRSWAENFKGFCNLATHPCLEVLQGACVCRLLHSKANGKEGTQSPSGCRGKLLKESGWHTLVGVSGFVGRWHISQLEHPRDITKDEEFQEEREALQSVSSPGQMESTWWGTAFCVIYYEMLIYLISSELGTICQKYSYIILYDMKSQPQTHTNSGSQTYSRGQHLEVMIFFSKYHKYWYILITSQLRTVLFKDLPVCV